MKEYNRTNMLKLKRLSESGFAPLIVTIIIVIVLSLMTLGFVALVDNNKQNALNQQLNSDAYYAAESGINDAIEAISQGDSQSQTTCQDNPASPYASLRSNIVNGANDYYSCLLINFTPSSLQYSSVETTQPTVAILSTVDPLSHRIVNTGSLLFSWQPSIQTENGPYAFAPSNWYPDCPAGNVHGPCLPPSSDWASTVSGVTKPIAGVMRLALTPLINGQKVPTDSSNTYTSILYPRDSGGAPGLASGPDYQYSSATIGENSGMDLSGNCTNSPSNTFPDACTVCVDVSIPKTSGFLMSLSSEYNTSQATIEGFRGSSCNNGQLQFQNAQTMIDSTGDDHGVLKRIQVRIPTLNDTGFPGYDLAASNTICADLQTYPYNAATNTPGKTLSSCGL